MDAPDGWRLTAVSELGRIQAGKAKNKNGLGAVRPYLRVANVFDGNIRVDDVLEMPFTDEEFERFRLEPGDILLNEGQSLGLVGRCSAYRGEFGAPCAIQNALIRFRAYPDVSSEFAEQLFRWCQQSGIFASIATQTTSIAHLSTGRFSTLKVRVPPLGEQRKIAEILGSVDEAIQATQAVIEQTRKVKQGLLQQLLTRGIGHTRFKQTEIGEIPESWEVVELHEVARIQSGKAKNRNTPGSLSLPYLRVANVQDGYIDLTEIKHIDADPRDLERYGLRPGDVLFTEGGDADKLGRGAVWDAKISPCLHQNHIFAVRCSGLLRPNFLAYYGGSQHGKRYFLLAAKQTTNLASINKQQLSALPLPVPPLGEQDEILMHLQALDEEILINASVLDDTKRLKAGLMQDLLTGKVRVTP